VLADYEDYVKMLPEASDAEEVKAAARTLRRMLALMN
jgi:regulator of sirC expression with transglutaminase-like and TPR domain